MSTKIMKSVTFPNGDKYDVYDADFHHVLLGGAAGGAGEVQNIEIDGDFDFTSATGKWGILVSFQNKPTGSGVYVQLKVNNDADSAGYLYNGDTTEMVRFTAIDANKYYFIILDADNCNYHLVGDFNRNPFEEHSFDGIKFNDSDDVVRFGVCSTEGSTAVKEVDIANIK